MANNLPLRLGYPRIIHIAIAVLLVFNLLTLGRVPEIPHGDDGGYASAAFHFWRTGHPGVPGYRNILDLDKDIFAFGRTAAAVQGVFMRVFGISLPLALLPSFLAGLGLLTAVYGIARSLWDKYHASLAVLLLAASGTFFSAVHSARPDMLLTLYLAVSLYFVTSASKDSSCWRYGAVGLIMGFSGDVHLNGFFLAPVPFLLGILLHRNSGRYWISAGLVYCLGVLTGVIVWLSFHYLPNPESFHQQIAFFGSKTYGIRVLDYGLFGAIQSEIHRYLSWFWKARLHRNLYEGVLILGSGLWMMINGGQKERAIFLVWLGIFWISVFFMSNSFGWYLIYVWPIFALWLTRTFMACCKIHRRSWMHWALGILIFCYIANLSLWAGKALLGPPYAAIAQELRLAIPPSSSVVAGGEWWFALHDRDYTDAQHAQFRTFLARTKKELKPSGWEKSWDQLKWQFVVAHGDIQVMLDCEVPLREAMVSVGGRREEEIREAREFSLNYCVFQKRIQTASTPVLVLKIEEGKSHVAR